MKKIAILACQKANSVCAGCACLNAFYDRRKAFERYADQDLRLVAFMRCSHCVEEMDPLQDAGFQEKLERLIEEGTECLHIGICGKHNGEPCPGMLKMAQAFESRGVEVIWGTH